MKSTVLVAAAVLFGSTLRAQCSTVWLPGDPRQGPDGPVKALTMWDPDGAGPLTPRLVAGGMFNAAGAAVTDHIAAWDGNTWQGFGSLLMFPPRSIEAVHALPNGDLIAGGYVASSFPSPSWIGGYLARWNGSTWSPLGTSINVGPLHAITSLPNGDIIVGGDFMQAGAVAAFRVARWDGVSWSALGQIAIWATVNALVTMPNGDILAGGQFDSGTSGTQAVRRWNGTAWSDLGAGLPGTANALALLPNGDVVVGGAVTIGGVSHSVARWNGTTWAPLGASVTSGAVNTLCVLPNGDVIAGGAFTSFGGTPAINVARWNGVAWSAIAGGVHHPGPTVSSLTRLPNGDLVAGISSAHPTIPVPRHHLLRWDGAAWSPLGAGNDGAVLALTNLSNGDVVAGGTFTTIGGTSANHVARRNGTAWSPLGAGITGDVQALVARPGGGVIAGGSFTQAGGVAASNIASWDGVAWSPLGAGTNGPVRGLAALANGDIVAVGAFTTAGGAAASNVARWNGSSWAPLGGGLAGTYANAAAVLANGDLVVGGQFTLAGGVPANNIARWNGTSWFPLGSGVVGAFATTTEVRAMLVRGSELVVSGNFFLAGGIPVNGIASWNGTSWSAMGSSHGGYAFALTTLPNGDLVSNLFRWDGVVWTPLVSIWPGPWPAPEIRAMAKGPGDALLLGGSFTFIGHAASAYCAVSAYVAELTTTCPATVIPFGASCASSAGPMALTSTSLPWLGSTFTATATGMPASSIALAVTGFGTASLPLASILPQGVAGCFLWTTPDFVAAALPTAGSVSTQLAIPNQPALIGQVFHHQVVPVELAPTGGLLAVTSTNRLTALIGVF